VKRPELIWLPATQQRKEVKTMYYEKPEIRLMDDAKAAIRGTGKRMSPNSDAVPVNFQTNPAYEADE
jgi:hypothetical protein